MASSRESEVELDREGPWLVSFSDERVRGEGASSTGGSGKEEAFPEIPRRMTKKQSQMLRVLSVTCEEPRRRGRGRAGAPMTQQRMRCVWLA